MVPGVLKGCVSRLWRGLNCVYRCGQISPLIACGVAIAQTRRLFALTRRLFKATVYIALDNSGPHSRRDAMQRLQGGHTAAVGTDVGSQFASRCLPAHVQHSKAEKIRVCHLADEGCYLAEEPTALPPTIPVYQCCRGLWMPVPLSHTIPCCAASAWAFAGLFRILRCDNAVDATRIGGDLRATHIDPEALTCSRSPIPTSGVLIWHLRISAPAAFLLKVLCVKALVVDPELLSLPITSIFILFYFSTSSGTGRRPADPAAPGSWHPQAFSPRGQRFLSPLGGVRSLSSQEKEGQGNKDEEGETSKEGGDSEEVRLFFFFISHQVHSSSVGDTGDERSVFWGEILTEGHRQNQWLLLVGV